MLVSQKYLEAPSDSKRRALQPELAEFNRLSYDEMRTVLSLAVQRKSLAGIQHRKVKVSKEMVPYLVSLPEGYDPAKPRPMLISIMGPGRDAEASLGLARRKSFSEYIVVSPFLPADDPEWPGYPSYTTAVGFVRECLPRVLREFAVDSNRITMTGFSMGGAFTWSAATWHPDWFAAVAPGAGHSPKPDDVLRNLQHVAVFCYHGSEDTVVDVELSRNPTSLLKKLGYDCTYREEKGIGHSMTDEALDAIAEWFSTKSRKRLPKTILYASTPKIHPAGRLYWIRVAKLQEKEPYWGFSGTIEKNAVTFDAQGIQSLAVLLNDTLFDPAGGLLITANGTVVFEGPVSASFQSALDSFRERYDPEYVFPYQVSVVVPPKK